MSVTASGMSVDIGDWLRGLGLARYEAAFRENEIGVDVLPKLTAEDLKDLGVALRRASPQAFGGDCGAFPFAFRARGGTPPRRRSKRPAPSGVN